MVVLVLAGCVLPVHEDSGESGLSRPALGKGQAVAEPREGHETVGGKSGEQLELDRPLLT